jgi:hypothetical protein
MYENITEHYKSCGHDVPGCGPLMYNCLRYLKQLARFREADRKWREGSQERCPPTPFNMFSCSDRQTAPKMLLVEVSGSCWSCIDRAKRTDLRVKVRSWGDYDEGLCRLPPYNDAGYETDVIEPPLSPVPSTSDGEEFEEISRPCILVQSHVVLGGFCCYQRR